MLDIITSIIVFIVVLGILVLIHELGHFLTAIYFKVGVHEFALGMPPRIKAKTIKGISFALNAVPIGGYVRLMGEDEDVDDPRSFQKKTPFQRLLILLAGSLSHFLLAFFLFALLVLIQGRSVPNDQVLVVETAPASPAQTADLQPGDLLLEINNVRIVETDSFLNLTEQFLGQPLDLTVLKADTQEIIHTSMTPRATPPEGQGPLGVIITQGADTYPANILQASKESVFLCFVVVKQTLAALSDAVVSILSQAQIPDGISGPVGIAKASGDFYRQGGFMGVVFLSALLAANLAVFNLLPLPGLDGGRMIFIVLEWIRGKKLPTEKEALVHGFGLLLLFAFLAAVTYKDILALF